MKRHITLLIENASIEDINKLQTYCNENLLNFEYRYGREWKGGTLLNYWKEGIAPLYYFQIFGDTEDFNKLNEFMNNQIILTDFAEICNIADMDDKFEKELINCIKLMKENISSDHKSNRAFLDFIMPIKDVKILEALNMYSCYMTEHQKQILKDRIDICSNQRNKIDEEFKEACLSLHVDVKGLRLKTGMNRREFADYFGIPYRTVEDWENKKSTCATYLFKLMEKELINNGKI